MRRRDQPRLDRKQPVERAGIGHTGQNLPAGRSQGDGGGQQHPGRGGFVQQACDQNGVKACGRKAAQGGLTSLKIAFDQADAAVRNGDRAGGGNEIRLRLDYGPAFEIQRQTRGHAGKDHRAAADLKNMARAAGRQKLQIAALTGQRADAFKAAERIIMGAVLVRWNQFAMQRRCHLQPPCTQDSDCRARSRSTAKGG